MSNAPLQPICVQQIGQNGVYVGNMDFNTWSVECVLVRCTRADMCTAVYGLLLSAYIAM